MQFVVISGRSGSGKSTALQLLEDTGFTCVDNLPMALLPALTTQMVNANNAETMKFAVGIDARNIGGDLSRFPDILASIESPNFKSMVVYLDAADAILTKRFSETRRKHPLTNKAVSLQEALNIESRVLEPVARLADITLDTSSLSLHELRSTIRKTVVGSELPGLALLFESFGFKYGVPVDADFMFDVRCLPNPYWQPELRPMTGLEPAVAAFLQQQTQVDDMLSDISGFLERWIPQFVQNNRSYLTVAIGCTGGMHRSVYLAEKLGTHFKGKFDNVQVRHRQLPGNT